METRSRSRARSQSSCSNHTEATTSILKRTKGLQTTDFTSKRVRFDRSIPASDAVVEISKDSDRGRKKATKRTPSAKRVSKPKRSASRGSEQSQRPPKRTSVISGRSSTPTEQAPTAPNLSGGVSETQSLTEGEDKTTQAFAKPGSKSKPHLPPFPIRFDIRTIFKGLPVFSTCVVLQDDFNELDELLEEGVIEVSRHCNTTGSAYHFCQRRIDVTTRWQRQKAEVQSFTYDSDFDDYMAKPKALIQYGKQMKAERVTIQIHDGFSNFRGDPNCFTRLAAGPVIQSSPVAAPSDNLDSSQTGTPTAASVRRKPRRDTNQQTKEDSADRMRLYEAIRKKWSCQEPMCNNRKYEGNIACMVVGNTHYEITGEGVSSIRHAIESGQGTVDNPPVNVINTIIAVHKSKHSKKRDEKPPPPPPPPPLYPPPYSHNPYSYYLPPPYPYGLPAPQPSPPTQQQQEEAPRSSPVSAMDWKDQTGYLKSYCKWLRRHTQDTAVKEALRLAEEALVSEFWTWRMIKREKDEELAKVIKPLGIRRLVTKGLEDFAKCMAIHPDGHLSDSSAGSNRD